MEIGPFILIKKNKTHMETCCFKSTYQALVRSKYKHLKMGINTL